jgi:ABC-type spermidine/putrescine transport system, permease component I
VYQILVRSFEAGITDYVWVLESGSSNKVLSNTFGIAATVTAVTVLLGFPYAYAMVISSPKVKILLLAAVVIPYWTSTMIRSFAWIAILQTHGPMNQFLGLLGLGPINILGTATAITIGMVQVLMPFAVLPMYAVLARLDLRLLQAAQGLGARPIVSFFKVLVPLSLPGIIGGAVLVFVLSLGFFITPALLGSPSDSMIAVFIESQINGSLNWGRAGALSGVLLVSTLAVLGVGGVLMQLLNPMRKARSKA